MYFVLSYVQNSSVFCLRSHATRYFPWLRLEWCFSDADSSEYFSLIKSYVVEHFRYNVHRYSINDFGKLLYISLLPVLDWFPVLMKIIGWVIIKHSVLLLFMNRKSDILVWGWVLDALLFFSVLRFQIFDLPFYFYYFECHLQSLQSEINNHRSELFSSIPRSFGNKIFFRFLLNFLFHNLHT